MRLNIPGSVAAYEHSKFTVAWIYGFGVDQYSIGHPQRQWLTENVLQPLKRIDHETRVSEQMIDSPEIWELWLVGGTSRTGSFNYNWELAQKRSEAIRKYLVESTTDVNFPDFQIWSKGLGEIPAIIGGSLNEIEDLLYRAVLLILCKSEINTDLPPVVKIPKRPIEKCSNARLMVDYFSALKEGWSHYQSQRTNHMRAGTTPTASPPREMTISALISKGWSRERANQLYHVGIGRGALMEVSLDRAMGQTNSAAHGGNTAAGHLEYYKGVLSRKDCDPVGDLSTPSVYDKHYAPIGADDPRKKARKEMFPERSPGGQYF